MSHKRRILLSAGIDEETVKKTIETIFEIIADDASGLTNLKNYEVKPIELFINSGGGHVYSGLALVDVILTSPTPIHTYCIGHAMSMGLWIYLAGHKRFTTKNATFMYHEVSGYCWDKCETMKQTADQLERLQQMYDEMITSRTKIVAECLHHHRDRKNDWYIPAKEALELGICEEIVDKIGMRNSRQESGTIV